MLVGRGLVRCMRSLPDGLFWRARGEEKIRTIFESIHGRPPRLNPPVTFAEKLCERMISLHRTESGAYTSLSDKVVARNFVKARVGEEYLTKHFWTGNDPKQLPFSSLPDRVVIKANHGSGQVIVWTPDKSVAETITVLERWLRENYYWTGREYQYMRIIPQLFVEEFLDDGHDDGPLDYRFWCFHGQPVIIQVDNHSHSINPFFSTDWEPLDLRYRAAARKIDLPKPSRLKEMLVVAEKLSKGFDFVRVDLYQVGDRVLFGEYTFTPVANCFKLEPTEWDERLGQIWGETTPGAVPDA